MSSYDILGNIAIIKGEGKSKRQKLIQARRLLKQPSVKSVFEKVGIVHGKLRVINAKYVAGEKNSIAMYCENACIFKFDIKTCYFSGRLSNERKEIAEKIKKKDKVLVMFAGVGPFPIVIYKYKKPQQIVGVELGKDCCKYFRENLKLNKIPKGKIGIVQGDVKKKVNKALKKFDVVVMARPNVKESFLKYGLDVCKKGSRIFYYGFCNVDEIKGLVAGLKAEAVGLKKKIKIMKVVRAGDIAPYKYRYRIEIKVLK